jgi:hypothetical protein
MYPVFTTEVSISGYYYWIGIAFLGLLSIGYFFQFRKLSFGQPTHLLIPIYVIIGAVSTFWINTYLDLGPVIAAGSIGVVASFIPNIIKHSSAKDIPAAIYCGAFVGMSSILLFQNYLSLILAATISGLLLLLTKDVLNGFGGKLGTIAFGGVVSVLFIFFYLC